LRGKPLGSSVDFDMAALAALPQMSFATRSPWFDQSRAFTGPLLRDVVAAAGAEAAGELRLLALDDYQVKLPVRDALRHDVIVARLIGNQPIPVREKGPLFVIYPFDSDPALRRAVYYSRSAWQLRMIEVL